MAADLSTILAVFAVLTDGDIESESWYLGAGPGNVGGLNRHNTVEADISPNREDFYLGCGDNHHLSSRLFKQNVAFAAADPSQQFTQDVMGQQFVAGAKFSQQNNPYLSYFPFPSIVSFVAFDFYPQFFVRTPRRNVSSLKRHGGSQGDMLIYGCFTSLMEPTAPVALRTTNQSRRLSGRS